MVFAMLGVNKVAGWEESRLTVTTDALLQFPDLVHGWVLATGAQKVAEVVEGDTAVSALVEEGESLLVVGRSLCIEIRRGGHDCDMGVGLQCGRQ